MKNRDSELENFHHFGLFMKISIKEKANQYKLRMRDSTKQLITQNQSRESTHELIGRNRCRILHSMASVKVLVKEISPLALHGPVSRMPG